MEAAGPPILTCPIQHTLKHLCNCTSPPSSSSSSSQHPKWVYAVFWRILPRIYPPPKWEYGGGVLDRTKGNKRNWNVVWEDGFCDLEECERVNGGLGLLKKKKNGIFGADIFFKLSHEVYSYGEGLVGKVAADNSHKWVFKVGSNENDPAFISSWNAPLDYQPKAWELHFNSGIKTIAVISVRDGIVQLGSFDKILEDMNLVISIQRRFSYLRSIPGILSIQRPLSNVQHPYNPPKHKILVGGSTVGPDEAQQLIGSKVNIHGEKSQPHKGPIWSFGSSYNTQENGRIRSNGPPLWPIPPLLPSNFGSHIEKVNSYHDDLTRIQNGDVIQCVGDNISRVDDSGQEMKPGCFNPNGGLVVELGFGPKRVVQENDVTSQLC